MATTYINSTACKGNILLRQITVLNVLAPTTMIIGVKPAVLTVLVRLPWQQQLLIADCMGKYLNEPTPFSDSLLYPALLSS